MVRLIKKTQNNYTNVSNQLIRDERLSWKARGIFIYLWSQSNEWNFYVSEIAKHATDGEDSLRSGIKELEKYGYLERKPAHGKNGTFNGMDWILQDHPSQDTVNGEKPEKMSERDSSTGDGEIHEKTQILSDLPSDGLAVERVDRRMENSTLRNNNIKNYQHKELSINKSSSSSLELDDEDDLNSSDQIINQRVSDLLAPILNFAKISNQIIQPSLRELKQIRRQVSQLSDFGFEQLNRDFANKISVGLVDNPIGYLLVMLKNEIESERFWSQPH